MVLSLNLLLLSEAFATSAASEASINDKWYLIVVSTALSGALVYMFKRYEQLNNKFNEEREKTFTSMQTLMEHSAKSNSELSDSIKSLNRDSEQRYRSMMDMLDRIHAK